MFSAVLNVPQAHKSPFVIVVLRRSCWLRTASPGIIFRKHPREVFGDYVILKEPTFFYNFGDRLNWSIEDKFYLVTLVHYKPYVSPRGRSQLSKMQVTTIAIILKYSWLFF